MLEHLKVSNVALIEEATIDFAPGLNILSGETGAGKSIVIDSINFVLGGRVSKDFIRTGAETADVDAFLTISHKGLIEQIVALGVEIDSDNALLIHRSHSIKGRSVVKANGKLITVGMLRDIAVLLMDVHGQHGHQSLLNPTKHLQLLDRFCQNDLESKKARLSGYISNYRTLLKNMADISGGSETKEHTIEMYKFQIQEIEAAKLTPDEEEQLAERRKVLANAEKITYYATGAAELLGGEGGVMDKMARVLEYADSIVTLDSNQKNMANETVGAYACVEEISREFARYSESLEHNPQELEEIEARLDQIYRLRQKYGRNASQIIEYYDEICHKLEIIEGSQEELARLALEKKSLEKEIGRCCMEMSKIRKDAAKILEAQIESILKDLGMKDARFVIEITTRSEFGPSGFDRAEFLISANVGEDLKPLSEIASGGEMSRVMLALKTALANYDTIETFIFDEIDAGISGRTAQQVAEKLSMISRNHQILCITHLPQIAAMGDVNFLIEKNLVGERTLTHVHKLEGEGKVDEITRLIGGAAITTTTEKAAREMIKLAQLSKKSK